MPSAEELFKQAEALKAQVAELKLELEKQTDDGDWTGMTGNYIRVLRKAMRIWAIKNQR